MVKKDREPDRPHNYQVVMMGEQMDLLKKKTGKSAANDALYDAAEYYINSGAGKHGTEDKT